MKKTKLTHSPIWRLFQMLLAFYKGRLLLVGLLIILQTLAMLAMTLFTKSLIDDYILVMLETGSRNFDPLFRALLMLSLALLGGSAVGYLSSVTMIFIGQGMMKRLRMDVFDHLQSLPISYFDTHSHGDIMSAFTNDVDSLRQIISRTIPQFFSALVTLASTFLSMVYLSIPLTLITLAATALMMKVSMVMAKRSGSYFKERQKNIALTSGFIEEMVSGQKTVKVLTHESRVLEDFEVLNEQLRLSVFKANRMAGAIMPLSVNMTNLGYALLAASGAALSIYYGEQTLSIGTLAAFLTLHKNFARPITMISQEANNIAMASAGAERIFQLQDEKAEVDEGSAFLVHGALLPEGGMKQTSEPQAPLAWKYNGKLIPLKGDVCFKNVSFSYQEGHPILHDINLTAYAGQKIAFVGGTGAGKTTITNLINRFYDTQSGEISLDGIPVTQIRKQDLRRCLGIVLQDTHLFSGSIMENIRYGNLEATSEQCQEAARLSLADGFIRRLPKGYHTLISSQGEELSEGERQLLSIARTAVAAPAVLILDEATSSIDTRSEKLIQKGMESIMKGRTTFVIAHRLSTIMSADYIVVLENGRIKEAGKHQELLSRGGRYAELFLGGEIT